MRKSFFSVLVSVLCSSMIVEAKGFSLFGGSGFGAPNVNGYTNAANPESGDIVFDTNSSTSGFYGYAGSLGWLMLASKPHRTPTSQTFTASGTYVPTYLFIVSSANATVGATYTNNGQTFVVSSTIAGATTLLATASTSTPPTTSGTLTKSAGTGDSTITFASVSNSPLYIRVRMAGGGGGGIGSGTSSGSSANPGTSSVFEIAGGATLLTAGGGSAATFAGSPAAGGTPTINAPAVGNGFVGGSGQGYVHVGVNLPGFLLAGGDGGNSPCFGGRGAGGATAANGAAGLANTGGGGGGGGGNSSTSALSTGNGGGSGACIDATIPNPSGTYTVTVGGVGTGGSAGGSGYAGGAGGSGIVIVEEFYQ